MKGITMYNKIASALSTAASMYVLYQVGCLTVRAFDKVLILLTKNR